MRIRISPEALENRESWSHLDQILYWIEEGTHEWFVDDPESIEKSDWLQGARSSKRELFEKAAMAPEAGAGSRRLHRRMLTVQDDAPPNSLTASKAARFLRKPLKVMVENRFTDGALLEALLAVLSPAVLKLLVAEAIRVDSPGGNGELKKLIEADFNTTQREGLPLRAVVFTDSDGLHFGDVSPAAKAVEEVCKAYGIPCVVLSKRAIENYVPDEIIRDWGSDPSRKNLFPRLEALLRLQRDQRDYFPIKKGLRKKKELRKSDTHQHEQHELYFAGTKAPALSSSDSELLEEGFGDQFIYSLFLEEQNEETWKTPLGRRRVRGCLTQEALRKRDDAGELERLVQLIEEHL